MSSIANTGIAILSILLAYQLFHIAGNNSEYNLGVDGIPHSTIEAFSHWKNKHSKFYSSPRENLYRLRTFMDSYNKVQLVNSNPESTYTATLYHHSDLLDEEFSAKYLNHNPDLLPNLKQSLNPIY